jgi:hypothetical protein
VDGAAACGCPVDAHPGRVPWLLTATCAKAIALANGGLCSRLSIVRQWGYLEAAGRGEEGGRVQCVARGDPVLPGRRWGPGGRKAAAGAAPVAPSAHLMLRAVAALAAPPPMLT